MSSAESLPAMNSLKSRECGYMLLFSLGLLVVVSTLILSITISQRIDTQLLVHEKNQLQSTYLLKGAAEYTAAQLSIASAVAYQRISPDDKILVGWSIWRPNSSPYQVRLDGREISVLITDLSGLPDANMLTLDEWQRLFVVLGSDDANAALDLAKKMMAYKSSFLPVRGSASFFDMSELLGWAEFTPEMIDGGTRTVPLGIRQLVTVGTGLKNIHIDLTPLVILRVLGNVTEEHLRQLSDLRNNGPVPPSQAQQWLQGTGLSSPPVMAPSVVSVKLTFSGNIRSTPLFAVLANENGIYRVIDYPRPPR